MSNDDYPHRLDQLRRGIEIFTALQEVGDEEAEATLQAIENQLNGAGGNINNASFDRHLSKAMGRAAGLALTYDEPELATRATSIFEDEEADG